MSTPRGRRGRPLKSTATTKLAALRIEHGYTLGDMAEMTGLSDSAYWRLEHNKSRHDVNLRALVNCAAVLHVDVTSLFEDEWLQWWAFDKQRPGPPAKP